MSVYVPRLPLALFMGTMMRHVFNTCNTTRGGSLFFNNGLKKNKMYLKNQTTHLLWLLLWLIVSNSSSVDVVAIESSPLPQPSIPRSLIPDDASCCGGGTNVVYVGCSESFIMEKLPLKEDELAVEGGIVELL